LVDVLWPYIRNKIRIGSTGLEPCSGDGAISARIGELLNQPDWMHTNDIDRSAPTRTHDDARNPMAPVWTLHSFKWGLIVSNPPYSSALPIVKNALESSSNVAMLLRLSFLEPTRDRAPFWEDYGDRLSDIIVIGQPRPSFTEDGRTDSVTHAWFVWEGSRLGSTMVRWAINWSE